MSTSPVTGSVGFADHPVVAGAARLFRYVAFAEALSWLGLLIGMFFKYALDPGTEIGVTVFGPIHGGLFVLYVVVALAAALHFRWSVPVTLVAVGASIPPFATAIFEIWAARTGRLVRPAEVGVGHR